MTPNPYIQGEALSYLEVMLKLAPEAIGNTSVLSQLRVFHKGFVHNLYTISHNGELHMVDAKYKLENENLPIPEKGIECDSNESQETLEAFVLTTFTDAKMTIVEGRKQFSIPDANIEDSNSNVFILERNGEIKPLAEVSEYPIDSDERSQNN